MDQTTTTSFSAYFTFPFRGKEWGSKLLIGFALFLLGMVTLFIPSLFVLGYLARLMRRVIGGGEPEMPAWYDWGELFTSGLKVAAAALIYSLPSLLVMGAAYFSMIAPAFLPILDPSGQDETVALLVMGGSFSGLCLIGAGMLVWLATALVAPVAVTHLIAEDSFAAAFRFKEWWRLLRANLGGFMVALILVLGLVTLAYLAYNVLVLTVLLCILTPLALVLFSLYQLLVGGALYAGAYREALERTETHLSVAEAASSTALEQTGMPDLQAGA